MLTARDSDRDRIRGFQEGGDDYVTKPFNVEFRRALCRCRHWCCGYAQLHAAGMLEDRADLDRAMDRIGAESVRMGRSSRHCSI